MKACDLLKSLRKTLHSEKFQNKHKTNLTDFSRKPVLSFPILFTFILKGIKNSLQTDLFNLTDTASLSADVSKQAFSDARKKLLASAFSELKLWRSFTLRQENELKKLNIEAHKKIPVRVVLIDLPESEDEKCEVLLTSLINDKVFKYDCFKELYFFRWGIEENIKFFKLRIEIENFGGMTPHAVG